MLRILFNRDSPVIHFLEIVGVVSSILFLRRQWPSFDGTAILFIFFFLSYLFIRICDWIPWYKNEPRGRGIEVHFQKALVPSSYILAITSLVCLLEFPILSLVVVLLADLMMLVVAPVNGILIYFHLKDKDPLPINYFSANKYLTE